MMTNRDSRELYCSLMTRSLVDPDALLHWLMWCTCAYCLCLLIANVLRESRTCIALLYSVLYVGDEAIRTDNAINSLDWMRYVTTVASG